MSHGSETGAGASGVEYLDPYGPPARPVTAYTHRLNLEAEPRVIALFSNMFVDSAAFLDDVARAIGRVIPQASFKPYDKGQSRNLTATASPEVICSIRRECSAAILAYGHCGSCTAALVRDAVELARAGVPVAAMITAKFREEAEFIARGAGIPGIPLITLPHPVAGQSPEYHQALAQHAGPTVMKALLEGASGTVADVAVPVLEAQAV